MKPSHYNHLVSSFFPGKTLAFNALSGMYMELDDDLLDAFSDLASKVKAGKVKPAQLSEFQQTLVEKGFFVDEDLNERAQIHSRYFDVIPNVKGLSLTIAPTISCNFGCGYCFQSHSKNKMGDAEIEKLLAFVTKKLPENSYLTVMWFGGEPMNAFDVIQKLAPRLHEIAMSKNCSFSHSIITNGFLLTEERARFLASVPGFEYAQITLDGEAEFHDTRRVTLSGKPTFDRILENVKKSAEHLHIAIRINVDRRNFKGLEGLLDTIEQRGLKNKVNIYLGHVWNYTAEVEESDFLTIAEFAHLETRFKLAKIRRGFAVNTELPSPRTGPQCVADHPNGFVVGPTGLTFNCWNEVHMDADRASGQIDALAQPTNSSCSRMKANNDEWKEYDPFTHELCKTCDVAPLCMAGCPWEARKKGPEETGFCTTLKYNLADELRLYDLNRNLTAALREQDTVEVPNLKTPELQTV